MNWKLLYITVHTHTPTHTKTSKKFFKKKNHLNTVPATAIVFCKSSLSDFEIPKSPYYFYQYYSFLYVKKKKRINKLEKEGKRRVGKKKNRITKKKTNKKIQKKSKEKLPKKEGKQQKKKNQHTHIQTKTCTQHTRHPHTNFRHTSFVHEYIGRLDITVHNVVRVENEQLHRDLPEAFENGLS
jgi:phenylalanyl-tRNA synthetase alpha subunit